MVTFGIGKLGRDGEAELVCCYAFGHGKMCVGGVWLHAGLLMDSYGIVDQRFDVLLTEVGLQSCTMGAENGKNVEHRLEMRDGAIRIG